MTAKLNGTLWGVGVGPGDPDLVTVKAQRLLQTVPVLAWPAPLEGLGLARSIASPHIPDGKIEIAIRLSFRPERDDTDAAYNLAADAIAAHLDKGRDVAVLCEGDPLFYGSFAYILERLGDRFPVRVIPGIASPMAAAAGHLMPLSGLDDSLVIIPATKSEAEIAALLAASDRAVIMKLGRHLPKIRRLLDQTGRTGMLAERVGLEGERLLPLAQAGDEAAYFSLILVQK